MGGIRFGRKKPWNFNKFVTLPSKILDKNKLHPCKFYKIVLQKHVTPLKFQDQKRRQIFLDLGISTYLLMNPWKSPMLFLNTFGNCMSLTTLFFSRIAQ